MPDKREHRNGWLTNVGVMSSGEHSRQYTGTWEGWDWERVENALRTRGLPVGDRIFSVTDGERQGRRGGGHGKCPREAAGVRRSERHRYLRHLSSLIARRSSKP